MLCPLHVEVHREAVFERHRLECCWELKHIRFIEHTRQRSIHIVADLVQGWVLECLDWSRMSIRCVLVSYCLIVWVKVVEVVS